MSAASVDSAAEGPAEQVLPAEFRHDRITLVVPAGDGAMLRFYTETGGGWNAISPAAAARLGAASIGVAIGDEPASRLPLVAFPAALERAGVPRPQLEPWLQGGLVVVPTAQLFEDDGFLGSRWFADRVWQIDYVRQSMRLLHVAAPPADAARAELGFALGPKGVRRLNFPRLTVTVDGSPIRMLLDTGATATLAPAAAAAFGLPAGTLVATSFITKSTFEKWAAAHPDWRVLSEADALGRATLPMIEVPRVTIAGLAVGPVWFTQRPDANLRSFMSQMTDEPVEGALGGSAFRHLRMTLDYPAALAYFELMAPVR